MRFHAVAFSVVFVSLCGLAAADTEVRVTAKRPPVLADPVPDGVTALALSPDGSRMAYAVPAAAKDNASEIHWIESSPRPDSDAPSSVTMPGTVRDLLFLEDNRTLLGLQYRPAKKQRGNTVLFEWDGDSDTRRIMRVPPSSSDLDRWPGGNAILLACRNEIRTILPPDFRSGPLFGVPGDNLAVTSLGSSPYVLVGQSDRLLLIDLSAPSGREAMPVLTSQALDAPVAALADIPDGGDVLVRLRDGRLFVASFDPPALTPAGSADRIAALAKSSRGPRPPSVAPAPVTPAEPSFTEPEPEQPAEASPEPAPQAQPHGTPAPDPAPPTPAPPTAGHQIGGTIVGSHHLVAAVVLLGPNNILKEAARVPPAADGTWGLDGLAPGRYRIQLDAGGDRVLVAEPRFLMVDVGPQPSTAPEIKVLRSF